MNDFTRQIQNWLIEIEEKEASLFLDSCLIDNYYIDTLFGLSDDLVKNMFDVAVFVPPKVYKSLDKYSTITKKIEEAIADNAEGDNIYVRNIEWKPLIKSAEEFQREQESIEISKLLNDEEYVKNKLKLMNDSVEKTPHLAIGTAKELIETCCKAILLNQKIVIDKDWDLLRLVKETNKVIELSFMIKEHENAKQSIKLVLGGLSNIVHGVSELRNSFGSGHGHKPEFKEIDKIFARLAVSASNNFTTFYLSIHNKK